MNIRKLAQYIFPHKINDQNHYGIDITAVEGDPVYASATGTVIFSGWTYDLGNIVIFIDAQLIDA